MSRSRRRIALQRISLVPLGLPVTGLGLLIGVAPARSSLTALEELEIVEGLLALLTDAGYSKPPHLAELREALRTLH